MRGQEVSCEANINIEPKNLEIVQSCQNLKLLQDSAHARSQDSKFETLFRGVPIQGYIIFYTVAEDCLEIFRVASGSRDWNALFPDSESE